MNFFVFYVTTPSVYRYNLEQDDVVVFKLTTTGFKIDIYKSIESMARRYACPKHV